MCWYWCTVAGVLVLLYRCLCTGVVVLVLLYWCCVLVVCTGTGAGAGVLADGRI